MDNKTVVIGRIAATIADELAIRQYAAFLQNDKMIASATLGNALGTETTSPLRSEGTPHKLHAARKAFTRNRLIIVPDFFQNESFAVVPDGRLSGCESSTGVHRPSCFVMRDNDGSTLRVVILV